MTYLVIVQFLASILVSFFIVQLIGKTYKKFTLDKTILNKKFEKEKRKRHI